MIKLNFKLKPLKNPGDMPFDDDWVHFELTVIDKVDFQIINTQWNFTSIFDWFKENRARILFDEFPLQINNEMSVIENIDYLYNIDELETEKVEKIHKFREGHSIAFAFRGHIDRLDIIFARKNDSYEISYERDGEYYAFQILKEELIKLLDYIESYKYIKPE